MKDTKKMLLAVAATILIVIIVITGTYAYWQWQTSTEQQTEVSFVIDDTMGGVGKIGAEFVGSGTVNVTNLEPSGCGAGIKQQIAIQYYNTTPYPATISVDLVATNFTIRNTSYAPDATDLSYLHWALTKSNSCTDPADSSSARTSIANDATVTPAISDNFAEFNGTFSTTTSTLKPTIAHIEFVVEPNTGSEETPATATYYLYTWLDKYYEHLNTGGTNSDPMQGLSFTLQWQNAYMEQTEA